MTSSKDKFQRFRDLAAEKTEGIDYRIIVKKRPSPIAIIAPHGGMIEPTTSEIAAAIASDRFSLYVFEGLKAKDDHWELHISSELFDEPQACQLVEKAETVVAIHGRKGAHEAAAVWVGGLDLDRRDRIAVELSASGFHAEVRRRGQPLAGVGTENICNRGATRAGVQLEIPRAMRDRLAADGKLRAAFAQAVWRAILTKGKL